MSADNLFLFLAFALSYWKTSELLAAFAPKQVLGVSDPIIPYVYGMGAALLVELFAWYRYKKMKSSISDTRMLSFVFGMIAVSFAVIANALDSMILGERLSELSPAQMALLTWVVPSLPALFLALHFVSALFEKSDLQQVVKQPHGVKSLADNLFSNIIPKSKVSELPKAQPPKP